VVFKISVGDQKQQCITNEYIIQLTVFLYSMTLYLKMSWMLHHVALFHIYTYIYLLFRLVRFCSTLDEDQNFIILMI